VPRLRGPGLCQGQSNGEYLAKGKTVTGFANVEEDFADNAVWSYGLLPRDKHVMPWRIEDQAQALGANYVQGGLWRGFAVRDGNLITGQQNFSGGEDDRGAGALTRAMKIGILGAGNVGMALARALLRAGQPVTIGVPDPARYAEAVAALGPQATLTHSDDAAARGEDPGRALRGRAQSRRGDAPGLAG
jgi:hypothetical protein